MNLTKRSFLSATLAGALSLSAGATLAKDTLSVVATTGMIAEAAAMIGGDGVEVRTLMGAGVDPHGYRQTRSDIVAMAKSDLVLWNGLYLEAQMEDFLLELADTNAVVAVAEDVPQDFLIASDEYENRFDPHLWMNPDIWAKVVGVTRDAMIAASPAHEAMFTANAETYLSKISGLSEYTDTALASVQQSSRILLTSHDAFNYFGAAYGFDVIGIQGISTESEAGLQRIAKLVDLLIERDIRAVFVETSVSDRNIRALVEGARAQGHEVIIGGELYSDAMGEPGTYEGTYIGMIDSNATTIARALGGVAPDAGMQGLLN